MDRQALDLYPSFFDELEKIADYSTAAIAHELGHAQAFEQSKIPVGLDIGGRAAIKLVGNLASYLSTLQGKPGLAAISSLVADSPTLVSEGRASYKALKSLKEMGISEDDYKTTRKNLAKAFGTYMIPAAANALTRAGASHLMKKGVVGRSPDSLAGTLMTESVIGMLGSGALKKSFDKTRKDSVLSREQVEQLKKQMGVATGFYKAKKSLQSDAYMPPQPKILRKPIERSLKPYLREKSKSKEIVEKGGILLLD